MSERKFIGGFNFRGIEELFEGKVIDSINGRSTPGFRYIEVGLAAGTTLISVADLIREHGPHEWQCVGIDIVNGHYFDPRSFLSRTLAFNTHIEFEGQCTREPYIADRITAEIRILLLKGTEKRTQVSPNCVNFALIDGCHGAPCVEKDFLALEPGIAMNGIVAFHDAAGEDQGQGFQPHCQMHISVLEALAKLGLWGMGGKVTGEATAECVRPGWKFIGCKDGDKTPGNATDNGNGIIFFQKVAQVGLTC